VFPSKTTIAKTKFQQGNCGWYDTWIGGGRFTHCALKCLFGGRISSLNKFFYGECTHHKFLWPNLWMLYSIMPSLLISRALPFTRWFTPPNVIISSVGWISLPGSSWIFGQFFPRYPIHWRWPTMTDVRPPIERNHSFGFPTLPKKNPWFLDKVLGQG